MKRLKHYLLGMDKVTTTYKEMYEGETTVTFPDPDLLPEVHYDTLYWQEEISYRIERTHKLAQDKPTIIIQIPCKFLGIEQYTVAVADYCLRQFEKYIEQLNALNDNRKRPDVENGKYYIYKPTPQVLERNAVYFGDKVQKDYINLKANQVRMLDNLEDKIPQMNLCMMIQVQLPAKKIRKSIQMLCKDLPEAVDLFVEEFDTMQLKEIIELEEKQKAIRDWLKNSQYCTFIANGSILPRAKGTELPMKSAIPFVSTPEDEIEVCGIQGMGIKKGVTVITGGGYSGKSTLLDAISAGIYNHVKGDGRELVITEETAIKIAAEDGRSIKNVNIAPFIKWLPGGDTMNFSTTHASGSTSQAANIMEAVNYHMQLLLIDEDKSATNFMIRDRMMKELIEKEPITPFTERVQELYKEKQVSTILVIGGSGEYLSVADKIYKMDDYVIKDVTQRAKGISGVVDDSKEQIKPAEWLYKRALKTERFSSYPEDCGSEKLEVSDMGFILCGDERIDIRMLHHVVSKAQLNALGFMLRKLEVRENDEVVDIETRIDQLYEEINEQGIEMIFSNFFTTCERFLDLPRKYELMAVINRMRHIDFESTV